MVRLVALADTHLGHQRLEVPEGDVLVHAGDLCGWGASLEELAEAARWLRALPHRHKVVVAGNHDWPFVRTPQKARALLGGSAVYLEDGGATVGGLRFWGSPWQPEFGDWAFNLPRGAPLAERWARIPEGVDVLVTHGPPHGLGDRAALFGPPKRVGCEALAARVKAVRPLLHLWGHIHEDGGLWRVDGTTSANVTVWEGERGPTVLDVDVRRRRVVPVVVQPSPVP